MRRLFSVSYAVFLMLAVFMCNVADAQNYTRKDSASYRYKTTEKYIRDRIDFLDDKSVRFVDDGSKVVYYSRRGKEVLRFEDNRMILPAKGERLHPKKYLKRSFVRSHKRDFKRNGSAVVVIRSWTVGNPKYQSWASRKFVGVTYEMDSLIDAYHRAGDDISVLNEQLGLGGDPEELRKEEVYYIKIRPGDRRFRYDIPHGNERSAYEGYWVPGGLTILGIKECVLTRADQITFKNDDIDSFLQHFDKRDVVRLQ